MPPRKVKILLTIDFDAVSGYLGTGAHPHNNLSDYSAGIFSARVGVPRLLALFTRLGIANRVTWFLPGHSIESFPARARAIVASGAEIGLHGYCHEGAPQLSAPQQVDVLDHCVQLATQLTGRAPVGYRAPLYQVDEHTLELLAARGFWYDASLTGHDCRLYRLPANPIPAITAPRYHTEGVAAADWMRPLDRATLAPDAARKSLVEVPCNWYGEDMTPLQFFPNTPNSQGYAGVGAVEAMWRDRLLLFLRELEDEKTGPVDDGAPQTVEDAWDREERLSPVIYGLILHPDTSGMGHVIGMVERFLTWVKQLEDEGQVEFCTVRDAVQEFRTAGG